MELLPEELAEGLVVGDGLVVLLREGIQHILQPPLQHQLTGGLWLLRKTRADVPTHTHTTHQPLLIKEQGKLACQRTPMDSQIHIRYILPVMEMLMVKPSVISILTL